MKHILSAKRNVLLSSILTAALALVATPAIAQPGYGGGNAAQGQTMQQQPPAQEFDDATLDKFTDAAVELGQIQNEFANKLQGVQDPAKATEMQEQANRQMLNAVEEQGLDVQTYNAIANQLGRDAELKGKVDQMIMEKSQ